MGLPLTNLSSKFSSHGPNQSSSLTETKTRTQVSYRTHKLPNTSIHSSVPQEGFKITRTYGSPAVALFVTKDKCSAFAGRKHLDKANKHQNKLTTWWGRYTEETITLLVNLETLKTNLMNCTDEIFCKNKSPVEGNVNCMQICFCSIDGVSATEIIITCV